MLGTTAEKAGELAAQLRHKQATPDCTLVTMYDAQQCVSSPSEAADVVPTQSLPTLLMKLGCVSWLHQWK